MIIGGGLRSVPCTCHGCHMISPPKRPGVRQSDNPPFRRCAFDATWCGWRMAHQGQRRQTRGLRYQASLLAARIRLAQGAEPELIVTARRLDSDSPSVAVAHANAVFITGNTPAMMTGIRIPTIGCWEVTGHYGRRTLTFIVSVEP
jgi:hypothetical protein